MKKTGTPTSPRNATQEAGDWLNAKPVSEVTWITRTASAAIARSPSSQSWCPEIRGGGIAAPAVSVATASAAGWPVIAPYRGGRGARTTSMTGMSAWRAAYGPCG